MPHHTQTAYKGAMQPNWEGPLTEALERATTYLAGLPERRVGPRATATELHRALGGELPDGPTDPRDVIAHLAKGVEDGLLPSGSGRFFGFVFGGATRLRFGDDDALTRRVVR